MELSGRTVLLTGATGGIGHALARAFAAAGAQLVLTGRRTDVLESLRADLDATTVAADLSDPEAVHGLIADHGDADVVIANAALPASGRLDSFSEEQIDRALDVNLRAPIVLAHALVPKMVERGEGHFVLVSSLAGKAPSEGSSIYSATKFGLRGFGASLRAELHGTGVGVSTIFPGFIRDAGMFHESGTKLPKGVGTSTPDEVAEATVSAVVKNRGEVDVAPIPMRLGATFAGVAPGIAEGLQRRLGGSKVASQLADGQAVKR
jgi:uncharacterized protein